MGKRWEIERETTVRESPSPPGFEWIFGLLFWIVIIGLLANGCGG